MIDEHLVDTLHDIFEEYKQCEVGEEIAKALKLAGYTISRPQEPQKVVCPVPISCDYEECSHKKPHVRNNKCAMGCWHSGSPDCIPIPESLASTEMLLDEKTVREILRNMFAEHAWRVVNGERLDRDFNIYEQYSMVLDDFADEAIKQFKAQLLKCQSIIAKTERQKAFRELGEWVENETRGVNFGAWAYWWSSVIKQLKLGKSPSEDSK
jgi:hypothetical protein